MGGSAEPGIDPMEDRAVALLRTLDSHKTEEPGVAEPMQRGVARLVDLPVWIVLFWIVAAGAYYVGDAMGVLVVRESEPGNFREVPSWLSRVAFGVLMLLIFLVEVIPIAHSGRTFSKRRLRLLVVGPDGDVPGYRRAAIRWLVCWVPVLGCMGLATAFVTSPLWFLGFALTLVALVIPGWMFIDNDHRGLHDYVAGTYVLAER